MNQEQSTCHLNEKWKGRFRAGFVHRTLALAALTLPAFAFAASASAQQDSGWYDRDLEWWQPADWFEDYPDNQLSINNDDSGFYDNSYYGNSYHDHGYYGNAYGNSNFDNNMGFDYYDSDWSNSVNSNNRTPTNNRIYANQPNTEYGWSYNPQAERWEYGWHIPNRSSPSMGPVYGYYGTEPQFTNPGLNNGSDYGSESGYDYMTDDWQSDQSAFGD